MLCSAKFYNIWSFIKKYLLYFIVFCIAISARIYAISQKQTFHFDDPASIICTTPENPDENGEPIKESWAGFYFKYGHDYNALELKKMLFETKSDMHSLKDDLLHIRENRLDRDHSNFYYTFLRIWNIGLDYSNPRSIINRDCSLNLLFFTLSFFFMYKLLSLIRKDEVFIALGLLICFMSTGSVSCSLLIREYPIEEAFMIFLMYFFVRFYKSIVYDDIFTLTNGKKILYAIGLAVSLLSSYLSLIMLAIIMIVLTTTAIKYKKLAILKDIYIMLFLSTIFTVIFYPKFFIGIFNTSHPEIIHENLSPLRYLNFKDFGLYLIDFIIKYVYYFAIVFVVIYFLYYAGIPLLRQKFDRKELQLITIVLFLTFIWAYCSATVAPFKEDIAVRYVVAGFSLMGILTTSLLYVMNRYLRFCLVVLFVFFTFISFSFGEQLQDTPFKYAGNTVFFDGFSWLNVNGYIQCGSRHRNVVTVNRNWIWPNFLIYMPNDVTIRFEEEVPDENYDWDNYVLIDNEAVSIIKRY